MDGVTDQDVASFPSQEGGASVELVPPSPRDYPPNDWMLCFCGVLFDIDYGQSTHGAPAATTTCNTRYRSCLRRCQRYLSWCLTYTEIESSIPPTQFSEDENNNMYASHRDLSIVLYLS